MKNKVKKNNYKLIGVIVLIIVVGLVGIIQVGKAQIAKSEVAELTELANALDGNTAAFMAGINYLSGGVLGAAPSDLATGFYDVYVENDLTVDGTFESNGLQEIVSTGSFADATTTPLAIQNPFSATSTVDLAILNVTNGTSTMRVLLATSTSAFADGIASAGSLVNGTVFNTSTGGLIVNGTAVGSGSGFKNPGAYSQDRIVVGPNEWIVMDVAATDQAGTTAIAALDTAFTGGDNTFSGDYTIRWLR